MSALPRPVWLLGWVSLATDAASEAIYPLLPFFLTNVLKAGPVSLGIVEGASEAANSALKIVAGRLADRSERKRPLVLFGYSVSSLARPLMAVTTNWLQVVAVRVTDRIGKGVRGAPRDAMLARYATPATRGKVYGFHRGMDHLGAVLGPAVATAFLYFYPGEYRTLFALTIVPGAIAVALIFFVREDEVRLKPDPTKKENIDQEKKEYVEQQKKKHVEQQEKKHVEQKESYVGSGFSRTSGETRLPRQFTAFMIVLALFTLGNSTDAFLLLRLTDAAGSVKFVPLMWSALHVVKATVSIVGGGWSDRIGRRAVIGIGWIIYAIVYIGFAVSESLSALLAWFLLYGFHFGFAEGSEKALIADLAPDSRRGLAFGVYYAVQGLGALAASVLFGVIWNVYGAPAAFGLGAALALASTALLFLVL